MKLDTEGPVVPKKSVSALAIDALEAALSGSLKSAASVPRIAFAMLDPDDADIWVLDVTRKSGLLAREQPSDVKLTITLRPRTLLELFTDEGPDPKAPLIFDGDIDSLEALRKALSTPMSALALRCGGFS